MKSLFRFLLILLVLSSMGSYYAASDTMTIGSATQSGSSFQIPIYVRDVSGTPLGRDQAAGDKIQGLSIKIAYSNSALVSSASISRSGITASKTPLFESTPSTSDTISYVASFDESSALLPFVRNSAPGDQVATLTLTLKNTATPGTVVTLTLDTSASSLSNQGGTVLESVGAGTLTLTSSSLTVAAPGKPGIVRPSNGATGVSAPVSLQWTTTSATTDYQIRFGTASSPPVAATTASASYSPSTAYETTYYWNVTARNPFGSTTSDTWSFTTGSAPVVCAAPSAPILDEAGTVAAGSSFTVTWTPVSGAGQYEVQESTDPNFTTMQTYPVDASQSSLARTRTPADVPALFYRVRAKSGIAGCDLWSVPSNTVAFVFGSQAPSSDHGILPIVGSTEGSHGSHFRTSFQFHNPTNGELKFRVTYFAAGAPAGDPGLSKELTLATGATASWRDFILDVLGTTGIGTMEIQPLSGPLPTTLARVFNDDPTNGTTGMTERPLDPSAALVKGDTCTLVTPVDAIGARLNIGVRPLDAGATVRFTLRGPDGAVLGTATRSYPPRTVIQDGAANVIGTAPGENDVVEVEIMDGAAIVYGTITDNKTQDPSLQIGVAGE